MQKVDLVQLLSVSVLAAAIGCGNSGERTPTAPGAPPNASDVLALDVACPARLLLNDRQPCIAVAHLRNGQMPLVSFQSAWASSRPEVVAIDAQGLAHGKLEGVATVSASYQGRTGSADVPVRAEDALRVSAATEQGTFRHGSTVTMALLGFYSVASAESARLSLQISDQSFIVAVKEMTVSRGGDTFNLSISFPIPSNSTRLCRRVVLRIGETLLTEPQSDNSLACVLLVP